MMHSWFKNAETGTNIVWQTIIPTCGRKPARRLRTRKLSMALMRSDYASTQMLFPEHGTGGELLLLAFRGFNPRAAQFWEWVRADSKSTCGLALRDSRRVVAAHIARCDFIAGSEDLEVYLDTGILACQTTPR